MCILIDTKNRYYQIFKSCGLWFHEVHQARTVEGEGKRMYVAQGQINYTRWACTEYVSFETLRSNFISQSV